VVVRIQRAFFRTVTDRLRDSAIRSAGLIIFGTCGFPSKNGAQPGARESELAGARRPNASRAGPPRRLAPIRPYRASSIELAST
jgi:hypothetical protein